MISARNKKNLDKLRARAHELLDHATSDEAALYNIELEIQNQDLISLQLEYEKAFDRYLNIFETAPIAYIIINKNGLINEINEAGASLFGLKKENIINQGISRYIDPESIILFSAFKKHCFQKTAVQNCEIKLLASHGSGHMVQLLGKQQINHIIDKNELLIIATIINDRKQANWNTFYNLGIDTTQSNKSINAFVSSIAHELNHPLTVILNYVQGCIRRIESDNFKIEDIVSALKQAASQSSRATEIMLRMKEFKNFGVMKYEKVCLEDLIKSTLEVLKHEIMDFPNDLDLRLISLTDVNIDKANIGHVISNLVRNAIDAMRDDNTINPKLIIETNRLNKNEVEIKVLDNGPSIPSQIMRHLFIPHFTTKSYGLGLGLAISKSIVEAHRRILVAESNPVGGACFKFNIPIS
jgi:PAS domain S-box-containing protein